MTIADGIHHDVWFQQRHEAVAENRTVARGRVLDQERETAQHEAPVAKGRALPMLAAQRLSSLP